MEIIEKAINSPHKLETFLVVVAALFAVQALIKLWDWFIKRFGIETINAKREKEQTKTINNLKDEVDTIKTHQAEIKETVDRLDKNLTLMQEKQDAVDRAKLKDRILTSYKVYKERSKGQDTVTWSSMESEAFNDLIVSYQEASGNSFIHEKIIPETLFWEIVD